MAVHLNHHSRFYKAKGWFLFPAFYLLFICFLKAMREQ